MLTSHYFDTDRTKIHYVTGPDAGPPVLMLHGVTDRWQSFHTLIPSLSFYYTVFAVDFRGHGLSGKAERYTCHDYASDISLLLKAISQEPVSIIGHSLGAVVSMILAAHWPERCRAIIPIDPPVSSAVANGPNVRFSRFRDQAAQSDDPKEIFRASPDQSARGRRRARDIAYLDPATVSAVLDQTFWDAFDIETVSASITCPMLLLHGEPGKGSVLSKDETEMIHSEAADCVVEQVAGAGHGVHETHPDVVLAHILNFLDSV